jgi:K+-transporting ATPase KdpF subunit
VNGAGTFANVLGGVLALLLLIYLVIALIRPEKF